MIRVLDLYCKAGGAAMGYYRAFAPDVQVVGVDIEPQPRYPFLFVQDDALEYVVKYGGMFDLIHTSPPCQKFSRTQNLKTSRRDHPDLIAETRRLLQLSGKPYIIENVQGAPLINPLMLCGSMFGLGTIRHRLFETNPVIWFAPASCRHGRVLPMWWKSRQAALAQGLQFEYLSVVGNSFLMPEARQAMDIDWMTREEISQTVPPAYTEWIGRQLRAALSCGI